MPTRLKVRPVLMIAGILLLMTYQNCAQAPESDQTSQSSYQSGLPFAYKEAVDTIGYMSCSEIKDPVERRAYFSFRVSAFNPQTGGLTMTDAFRNSTKYFDNTARGRAIATSDVNANTRLNLSVRLRGSLQSIYSQGEMRAGDDIDSFLPSLDSAEVAGPVASVDARGAGCSDSRPCYVNYFPGAGSKRLMEASLRFYEFENIAKETRANLEGAGSPAYLTIGYGDSSDELDAKLRSPSSDVKRAYGTGYAIGFSLPNGYSSGERRVISPASGISEIDLTTGQPRSASWDCGATPAGNHQFMVIRPQDILDGKVICNRGPDRFNNVNEQAALNAIRRVLRVEDWFVDLVNHCVVPKRTLDYCYGNLASNVNVSYGQANCVNSGATRCPHFVSVCIRR